MPFEKGLGKLLVVLSYGKLELKQMKELTIRSERKADQNNEVYHFQFSAQKLDDKESRISQLIF